MQKSNMVQNNGSVRTPKNGNSVARKKNSALVNWIIVAVTLLTGLGIWASVSKSGTIHAASGAQSVSPAVVTDTGFNYNDNFLTQSVQPAQPSYSYTYPNYSSTYRFRTRGS